MCNEWMESFEAFLEHIGPRPSAAHSLERIRTGDGYKPGNVKWATRIEQANNKTNNRRYSVAGKSMTLAEISREYGIPYATLYGGVVLRGKSLRKMLRNYRPKLRH